MKNKKVNTLDLEISLTEAARLAGCDRATMAKRFVAIGEPVGHGRRYKLQSLIRAERGGDLPAERLRVVRATAERLEAENAKRAGEVVSREFVKQMTHHIMAVLFGGLNRVFCCEAPPALKGLDEMAIFDYCEKAIEEFKGRAKADFLRMAETGDEEPK